MTDQEILEEYKTTIEANIAKIISEYQLTKIEDIHRVTEKYKINFVIGFKKGEVRGEKNTKIAMAKKMLAKNKAVDEIIEFTGLTREQTEQLR